MIDIHEKILDLFQMPKVVVRLLNKLSFYLENKAYCQRCFFDFLEHHHYKNITQSSYLFTYFFVLMLSKLEDIVIIRELVH